MSKKIAIERVEQWGIAPKESLWDWEVYESEKEAKEARQGLEDTHCLVLVETVIIPQEEE